MSSRATKGGGKVAMQLGAIVVLAGACVYLFFGESVSALFESDSDPTALASPPAVPTQAVISPVSAATLTTASVPVDAAAPELPVEVANPPGVVTEKREELETLRDLRRNIDRMGMQLRVRQTEQQLAVIDAALEGVEIGITRLPELVGIVGGHAGRTAEFHVGAGRLVEARPQEWVTPEWQVVSIDTNAVQMRSNRGKVTTVLFGMRPTEDAPQNPQQAMPFAATANSGG